LTRTLANARAEISNLPAGLPVGAIAPGFALPSVGGGTVTLEDLRARGRPVALIFVSPDCGPCEALFPEVIRWQATIATDITLALVSSGTAEQNRAAIRNSEIEVLLQEEFEVAESYRLNATPTSVVVSPEGRVASAPVSSHAIENLIRLTLRKHPMRSSPSAASPARPLA
jgi:thiol-disulfide isomerase/thioredoxin